MRTARKTLVGVALVAMFVTGCEWNFETLDGQSNGPAGRIDAEVGRRGDPLSSTTADPTPSTSTPNTATCATRTTQAPAGHSRRSTARGGTNGRVNSYVGRFTAAVLYNGRPHVFYYSQATGDLRHGYWNGIAWAFETLDGAGGGGGRVNADVGEYNAVMLYNGRPHLFYYDASDGNLRHGYWNGIAWAFETLDGAGGGGGRIDSNVGAVQRRHALQRATAPLLLGSEHG
ncbi:MAG: hypothetical protein M5U31_16405 [Acidimicrobiia bacterium]|nr:hypothetical protein [Acidimicrobiia bacterium]